MGFHVLITGAAGFIATQLLDSWLQPPHHATGDDASGTAPSARPSAPPTRVLGLDIAPAPPGSRWTTDPRCTLLQGDAADPAVLQRAWAALGGRVDCAYALGATLTTQAETAFDAGLQVNVMGLLNLLQQGRAQQQAGGPLMRLVFASSIACYGGPLPEVVDEHVRHTPQTSYGTHKAINELLINDFARHGFVDGRALRLPIVVLRPGAPVPSVSDRVAGLVREPLRGVDVACPWRPGTLLPLASVHTVAQALRRVAALPAEAFHGEASRALNLPALSARVDEWVAAGQQAALERHGTAPRGTVHWQPDAALQAIVDAWPQRFASTRADALGLRPDTSVQAIVNRFVQDHPPP